jgi:hypothetical protein
MSCPMVTFDVFVQKFNPVIVKVVPPYLEPIFGVTPDIIIVNYNILPLEV